MLSTILLQRQTFLGYQRVANMRNHTSCPYPGHGKQVQRAFQHPELVEVVQKVHTNSTCRSFAENYQFNCNQFSAFCNGRLFCMNLFLTQVIIELSLCCNGYRSTVFSLSKQMFTGKMWTYSDRMNTQKKILLYFRIKNRSKRYIKSTGAKC